VAQRPNCFVRIAIVDIGTNSTRLLIGEVEDGGITAQLERLTTITRLGAGVDRSGRLAADAIGRVDQALEVYSERIERQRPLEAHAVLTSAVRDATNGAEFARSVAERHGLVTHVLDGDREALLTYRGALSGRGNDGVGGTTLVVDIGGGSTEFVLGEGDRVRFHVSTNAGVVRQSERHIRRDPPSAPELAAVRDEVRELFRAAVPKELRAGVERAIGVAGTPTSLAAIAQRLDPYDSARVHGYRLSAAQRDAILADLSMMTLAERQAVPGLQPARASVILPGIVILQELMVLFGLGSIEVSEHDILHGAMLSVFSGEL
jgi:exopolyphosphatase / guanosine-5'-triphosphate,3'-diphosphate pyrophosphatase